MRGHSNPQFSLFSYTDLEDLIPEHHLRKVRKIIDLVFKELELTVDTMYSQVERPLTPLELLMCTTLLQILFAIRSERLCMNALIMILCFAGLLALVWMSVFGIAKIFLSNISALQFCGRPFLRCRRVIH